MDNSDSFQSETPHFFKVILKDDILKGTLRIPKKFVQNHGSCLSNVVRLEIASGRVWEVELQRDDGDLFLQNGWEEFVRSCCISFGCFVVFRHEGYSRFHVVVFDVTACEVKYPANPGSAKKPGPRNTRPPELGRTDNGEARIVELSDGEVIDSTQNREGKKPLLQGPRPSKRSRDASPRADCSASELRSQNLMDERRDVGRDAVKREFLAGNSGALLRASSYKCQKPSTIVAVRSLTDLYLPLKFWTKCFPNGERVIKVRVGESKTWMIHADKSKYPRFQRGWRKFSADNNLTLGDVCLFEVMANTEAEFKVVIFRNGDVARMPNDMVDLESNDQIGRKNPLSHAVNRETSAIDPLMNARSSHLVSQNKLHCQSHSVASHKVRKTSAEKVGVEKMNEDGGFHVLTVDSNWKNPPSFYRVSTLDMGKSTEFDIKVTGDENSGTFQRASSFLCEDPSCIVVIRSIHRLYFPINFLTMCFPGGWETFGDIKVCVPGKGTWMLGINKERYPKFFKGCREFVADNELRIGDVCLFELMRSCDIEFRFVKFGKEDETAARIRALLRRPRKSLSGMALCVETRRLIEAGFRE